MFIIALKEKLLYDTWTIYVIAINLHVLLGIAEALLQHNIYMIMSILYRYIVITNVYSSWHDHSIFMWTFFSLCTFKFPAFYCSFFCHFSKFFLQWNFLCSLFCYSLVIQFNIHIQILSYPSPPNVYPSARPSFSRGPFTEILNFSANCLAYLPLLLLHFLYFFGISYNCGL